MTARHTGTVVVIPTRNRATIAMNAIRSVLDQPVQSVPIMVSDNSTSDTDRESLAAFCSECCGGRVRYVRPERPLAIATHWEWAIHDALDSYPQASGFLYLTDRMMFRRGALGELAGLAAAHRDQVISYNHDRIVDNLNPIRIEQQPASERLLEIDTVRLSQLLSQSVFHPAVPRMLNCIVARSVLNRIHDRFGAIFASISPDFAFCCRCLEVEDSILFYDKSPIFHYAMRRSNGASVTRGEMSPDHVDFLASVAADRRMPNFASPIPQLKTAVNYACHEYCLFKQQTNSAKFFDLDMSSYLEANAAEIRQMAEPDARAEMLALLAASGYREAQTRACRTHIGRGSRVLAGINRRLTGPAATPVWLFLARVLAIRPPGQNQFEFDSLDKAIDYARNISRGNVRKKQSHGDLLRAREIPIP